MQDFGALAQEMGSAYALTYYEHAAIGFGAAAFALVALASREGETADRRAGQVFVILMSAATLSALYFFAVRVPAPPVLISALAALYGMGMALLSLKPRMGSAFALQACLVVIPLLNGLLYFAYIALALTIPGVPIYLTMLGPVAGVFFLAIAWSDIQFLRIRGVERPRRLKRHGFRMALVCAEVVRAPLQSFGPPFLGEEHSFQLYAFAPLLLVPIFYGLARPEWLRPLPKGQPAS
ncbi:MAG: hypothetical protein AAF127_12370 [Pseudomonadota bacterium]